MEFPEEMYDRLDANDPTSDDEVRGGGRKSAEAGKEAAFTVPLMQGLDNIYQPCNQLCHLSGYCTKSISGKSILDLRKRYFYEEGKPAPKDKERAQLIMEHLRKAQIDKDNNITFVIDDKELCLPAFLRILGVTTSCDLTKAPGQ
jgi:hypothetical protein